MPRNTHTNDASMKTPGAVRVCPFQNHPRLLLLCYSTLPPAPCRRSSSVHHASRTNTSHAPHCCPRAPHMLHRFAPMRPHDQHTHTNRPRQPPQQHARRPHSYLPPMRHSQSRDLLLIRLRCCSLPPTCHLPQPPSPRARLGPMRPSVHAHRHSPSHALRYTRRRTPLSPCLCTPSASKTPQAACQP